MDYKTFLIVKDSSISRSVLCDTCRVLTWISSAKEEISICAILSISMSADNSCLRLVAVSKDCPTAGGVSSMF